MEDIRKLKIIRTFLYVLVILLFSSAFKPAFCQEISKPNIVLMYMDDMGWGDINSYGASGYLTPNIDRLVREPERNLSLGSAYRDDLDLFYGYYHKREIVMTKSIRFMSRKYFAALSERICFHLKKSARADVSRTGICWEKVQPKPFTGVQYSTPLRVYFTKLKISFLENSG